MEEYDNACFCCNKQRYNRPEEPELLDTCEECIKKIKKINKKYMKLALSKFYYKNKYINGR